MSISANIVSRRVVFREPCALSGFKNDVHLKCIHVFSPFHISIYERICLCLLVEAILNILGLHLLRSLFTNASSTFEVYVSV